MIEALKLILDSKNVSMTLMFIELVLLAMNLNVLGFNMCLNDTPRDSFVLLVKAIATAELRIDIPTLTI